jgi:predicted RNase H-like nuclease
LPAVWARAVGFRKKILSRFCIGVVDDTLFRPMRAVAGIDGFLGGWVAVVLRDGAFASAHSAPSFAPLLEQLGPLDAVGVDIPIGLPAAAARAADVEARKLLGPRRSSVFMTPPRAAAEAATYDEALLACDRLGSPRVSRQAFALAAKILDVEHALTATAADVREVHPECSFARMAGDRPPAAPKRTWDGLQERMALLAARNIRIPSPLGLPSQVAADDVLDAAAVAWTASRIAAGTAIPLPDPPEQLADGRLAAIWR